MVNGQQEAQAEAGGQELCCRRRKTRSCLSLVVTLIPAQGSHLLRAEWSLLCRLLEEMKWSLRPRLAHCAHHKGQRLLRPELSVGVTSFKSPLEPRGLETSSPRPSQDLPGFCFQRTSSERQGPLMSLKLAFPCRVTPARPAG